MNPAIWIAIYLPIFILLFIIPAENRRKIGMAQKIKRKRGNQKMSNEMIKGYIGKLCNISLSGENYQKVTITEVVDNWVKLDNKGQTNLVNADYILSIIILPQK